MLDGVSAASDEITELILDGKNVPEPLIRHALRRGTLENIFTPVHCGQQQALPRCPANYSTSSWTACPARSTAHRWTASTRRPGGSPPQADRVRAMSALAFKTVAEVNGDLVYIRVYSAR